MHVKNGSMNGIVEIYYIDMDAIIFVLFTSFDIIFDDFLSFKSRSFPRSLTLLQFLAVPIRSCNFPFFSSNKEFYSIGFHVIFARIHLFLHMCTTYIIDNMTNVCRIFICKSYLGITKWHNIFIKCKH